jgi:hypothetical protein
VTSEPAFYERTGLNHAVRAEYSEFHESPPAYGREQI